METRQEFPSKSDVESGSLPLDVNQMVDVTGGDAELVWDLFVTFRKEASRHLDELRQAAASGDVSVACDAAHAIKGSAATMGYNQVRDVARAVEVHAKAGELELAASKLGELESAMVRLEAAVKAFDQIRENPGLS